MAGMGILLFVVIDTALRNMASDAGQADAAGFHSRNGYPFAGRLLLERRTGRTSME
jgi:hypothetical protein